MRQSPLRTVAFAAALLVSAAWAIGAGWYVSDRWPVRNAMARVELAREEMACGNRSASPANQQRCRDLAEIVSRAELAEGYFLDGLVVFGPVFIVIGGAFWLRRGPRGGPGDHHSSHHNHHRPPAAA